MDRFFALRTLLAVVDENGFAAAAKTLEVSAPVVTRQIAALEAELKTELIARTTRRMELTEAGQAYVAEIRKVLAALAQADARLKGNSGHEIRALRIALCSAVSPLAAPAALSFIGLHPGAELAIDVLDRPVDPAHEGYDIALALGNASNSHESLARLEVAIVAAPAYCARHGRPRAPEDISLHHGLMLKGEAFWEMRDCRRVVPNQRLESNRLDLIHDLCVGGLGIAVLPIHLATASVAEGKLVVLLDGFEPKPFALLCRTANPIGAAFAAHLSAQLKQRRF